MQIIYFSLGFYSLYALCAYLSTFVIKFNKFSVMGIIALFVFLFCFLLGQWSGLKFSALEKLKKYFAPHKIFSSIKIEYVLLVLAVIVAFSQYKTWGYLLEPFNGFLDYLNNGRKVRYAAIHLKKAVVVPFYFSYLNGLVFAGFLLSMSYFYKKGIKFLFAPIYFFLMVVLNDLQSFGRAGTYYAIFAIASFVLLTATKKQMLKSSLLLFVLLIAALIPRVLRTRTSFVDSTAMYQPFLKIELPHFMHGFVEMAIYYFGSLFGFLDYMEKSVHKMDFGAHTFAPLYNLGSRFLPIERVDIHYKFTKVPMEVNVYTVVRDFHNDFGWTGIVLLSLIFGYFAGMIFKNAPQNNFVTAPKDWNVWQLAVCLNVMTWIFYSPIYTLSSFGGYFISFVVLLFLWVLSFFKCQEN